MLIPILELEWHPIDASWDVVDDDAKAAAGVMLGLEGDWDVAAGRSAYNHGFDLLTSYSNQTSEHYGFAYYKMNACFHFGQSEELGEYSWLTIVADWAENLIQHEISHNFGAYDRDRTFFPPSVRLSIIINIQVIIFSSYSLVFILFSKYFGYTYIIIIPKILILEI